MDEGYSPPPYEYADEETLPVHYTLGSLLYMAFLLWMLWHSYKRYGLSYWLFVIFFFQPLGGLLYFIIHANDVLRSTGASAGGGRGLFGWGLRGRIREAERSLRLAETEAARSELAELYFQDRRYEDAEHLFLKLLEADEDNEEALYRAALCRLEREDRARALELLEKLMARNKKFRFGQAWLAYAQCLAGLERRDEALDELRQLARSFPRPRTEFAYASMLAEQGQPGKARAVLEEMLDTSHQAPAEDRPYVGRGKALLRSLRTD